MGNKHSINKPSINKPSINKPSTKKHSTKKHSTKKPSTNKSKLKTFPLPLTPETETIIPLTPETETIAPLMPETETIIPLMPETETIIPLMPETETITPLMPETKTITPFIPETENISICYIIIPNELIGIIISHLGNKPLSKFATVCTKLSQYCYAEIKLRIATWEFNALNLGGCHNAHCKSLKRRREKTITPEATLKITDLKKSQSDDNCSLTVWDMIDPFELPDNTCASFHTLVINFSTNRNFRPDDSFWKKLPNVKSILLNRVDMDSEILLMLSKLPLLESLFLYHCRFWAPHSISTLFDYCPTLKEFHMTRDDCERSSIDLIIHQQLEIFKLTSKGEVKVELKNPMNLQSFSAKCDSLIIIANAQFASLEKLKLDCSKYFKILGKWENLFTNVKKFSINAFGCYTAFGTLTNSTTIPRLNEVPKYTFGTYHLNFLMFKHIKRVMIATYCDRDNMLFAFPLTDSDITVEHVCVQNGKHVKSKHDLSQGPIIVECLSGKESTEKKFTLSQWAKDAH
jgi:hypothetical protein